MYSEDQFIQLSALQHYLFCPRQCALAYLELSWSENLFTAEGRIMHNRVHEGKFEKRGDLIQTRGLWISSARLGLSGQTDLIEFHRTDDQDNGTRLPGYKSRWKVYPVEFKRGKPKSDHSDEVQLCAQALCLEEMLETTIAEGAIFYGKNKRRHAVKFDEKLRSLTEQTALQIHQMFESGITPKAEFSKKCKSCSLYEICLPKRTGTRGAVKRYLNKIISESITSGGKKI
ncbi:MAG: CRISPR-associated protein Cas4 [Syntrophaceae bacterium]|nr:CRISPR-associated protein Cas4 [Syntrophaceae bacterium]